VCVSKGVRKCECEFAFVGVCVCACVCVSVREYVCEKERDCMCL